MSKYTLVKECIAAAVSGGPAHHATEAEVLEALIVQAVAELARCAGPARAADALRYELANIGGDVDTVFLRSR